jgi:hypothetical protein
LCAEPTLTARHAAFIGFVIVTGEMQQSMEHQDLDLDAKGVAARSALAACRVDADGQIACDSFLFPSLVSDGFRGREREHIGGLVLASVLAIYPPDGAIGGEQHIDFANQANCGLSLPEKTCQATRGKPSPAR